MRLPSLLRTAGALAGFLSLAADVSAAGPAPIQKRLEKVVRAFPGTLGIAVKNLDTGESFAVNGDVRFPTASLIKVAVMVETYHQIAEGKFGAETAITLAESDKAGDEPVVLNQLHPGISLTVSDLLALMIAFSDNTATNLLVRRVGAADARYPPQEGGEPDQIGSWTRRPAKLTKRASCVQISTAPLSNAVRPI